MANLIVNKDSKNSTLHDCFLKIESFNKHYLSCSDQTGRFPLRSRRNRQYVFELSDTASNHIFAEQIRSRPNKEISTAYSKIYAYLKHVGISSILHSLDNKSSTEFESFLQQNHLKA